MVRVIACIILLLNSVNFKSSQRMSRVLSAAMGISLSFRVEDSKCLTIGGINR